MNPFKACAGSWSQFTRLEAGFNLPDAIAAPPLMFYESSESKRLRDEMLLSSRNGSTVGNPESTAQPQTNLGGTRVQKICPYRSMLLKGMVGTSGFEPETSTVSR